MQLVARTDVVGKVVQEVFPEFEHQGIYELFDTVYATGTPFMTDSLRVRMRRASGVIDDVSFKVVFQPIPDAAGVTEGIAVVATDVTELANARREAEGANRAKDEFLAMLGHELRNPLAPILDGAAADARCATARRRPSRSAPSSSARCATLSAWSTICSTCRASRAARSSWRASTSRSSTVVAQAVEMASPLLEERRHNLTLRRAARGLIVRRRPCAAAQVVAEPAHQRGEVHRAWRPHRGAARRATETRSRSRSATTASASQPRCCRGCSICSCRAGRRSIARRAGSVSVSPSSGPSWSCTAAAWKPGATGAGRGSEFVIRLPAAQTATVPTIGRKAPRRPTRGPVARVLVVDDNRDAAAMLSHGLRSFGYDVQSTGDGPRAIELAAEFRPHVVLLDLGLPVMDGYEVAERLRASGVTAQTVAVTGYGQETDRARSAAAGFAAHLVKPVDLGDLKRTLDRLLSTATSV